MKEREEKMKYYEFVVCKNGFMVGSYNRKADAIETAHRYETEYPDEDITVKAHVYSKPINSFDVWNYYMYSYDVQ